MTRMVEIEEHRTLEDYEAVAHLAPSVRDLREEASRVVPRLEGRTVWMVNSTSQGGGVAEMLSTMVTLLRDLGLSTEWVTIESEDPDFFALTKRIHNMIHGEGDLALPHRARRRECGPRSRTWSSGSREMAPTFPRTCGKTSVS